MVGWQCYAGKCRQSICHLPTFQNFFLKIVNRVHPQGCLLNIIWCLTNSKVNRWLKHSKLWVCFYAYSKSATYLWSKDVEVSSAIGSADELAFVLGRDSGVFGNPNHRGTQPVGVQVQAIERLTLLLTETLTWTWKEQPQIKRRLKHCCPDRTFLTTEHSWSPTTVSYCCSCQALLSHIAQVYLTMRMLEESLFKILSDSIKHQVLYFRLRETKSNFFNFAE